MNKEELVKEIAKKTKLSQKTSKLLQPNYKIDEDLLAGVVIKFEDKVIDSSIRNRFEKMKQNLLK